MSRGNVKITVDETLLTLIYAAFIDNRWGNDRIFVKVHRSHDVAGIHKGHIFVKYLP